MSSLTGLGRRREQAAQELLLRRLTVKHRTRITRELRRAGTDAIRLYMAGNSVAYAMDKHRENMAQIMTDLWMESGNVMGDRILDLGSRKFGVNPYLKKDERTGFIAAMMDWIRSRSAEKVTEVTETTIKQIRREIERGRREGLGQSEIAQRIRDKSVINSPLRSNTIARTETHGASQVGADAAARATGLQMERVWSSAPDDGRTREDHLFADGQRVGMNEPFIVGGVELMRPGDYDAGAPEQTINCRCCVFFDVIE